MGKIKKELKGRELEGKQKSLIITYKFKIQNKQKYLSNTAKKINFIWNYCNETSFRAINRDGKFLSWIDLNNLTQGSSKLIKLHSQTIQSVCEEYAKCREQFKKRKLKWRLSGGSKRSLGWIPFKKSGVTINIDAKNKRGVVTYCGMEIRFNCHRPIIGEPPTVGCFVADA